MTPGGQTQSQASCQLGGCENVSGRVTCDLRGGHEKVDPFDSGIPEKDCEKMSDAGHGGSGLALMEKAFSGHDVDPFWEGMIERNPDFGTSSC